MQIDPDACHRLAQAVVLSAVNLATGHIRRTHKSKTVTPDLAMAVCRSSVFHQWCELADVEHEHVKLVIETR